MPRAMVLAVVALLAACSLAPRHERPQMPARAEYPQEYAGDVAAGAHPAALGWRDFFADARLEALIAAALEHNRDLVVAVQQIEEARGLYRIQRADRLPTIIASADATRTRAGAENPQVLGATAAPGSQITFDRYSVGATVASFELDLWGRVRNLSQAALAEYLASVEGARSFRLTLIREVSLAYLALLESSERLALAQATVDSRREGLRIAKRRLDAGVTSALDYRQAETLLTQAETELAALQLAKAQNENALTVLLGAPIPEQLPEPLPLARQASLERLAAGLPSDLLENRPDILAAELRLRAAHANVGAARAAFFPSISLTGTYGYASDELDRLVGPSRRAWTFGPAIDLPIFDFGRRRADLSVAHARENIAIADYERTIQAGFQEVSDALAGRRYLAQQVAAQERATAAQRELAGLAHRRYNEGVVSYLEVLDAERNLFDAEQALLQVRRAEVANLVTLYVALGGGAVERGSP